MWVSSWRWDHPGIMQAIHKEGVCALLQYRCWDRKSFNEAFFICYASRIIIETLMKLWLLFFGYFHASLTVVCMVSCILFLLWPTSWANSRCLGLRWDQADSFPVFDSRNRWEIIFKGKGPSVLFPWPGYIYMVEVWMGPSFVVAFFPGSLWYGQQQLVFRVESIVFQLLWSWS